MPYNRDEVLAAVADYYDFLTRLHITPQEIRRPPPSGWPQVTQESLSRLGKTAPKVTDLLKHLP